MPAAHHYTRAEDGLAHPWSGRVYLNPPYGREIESWVRRLVDEYAAGRMTEAIALLPARTDTRWFQLLGDWPICFVRGRLKFSDRPTPAPFPSILVYFGTRSEEFRQAFAAIGDTRAIWEEGDATRAPTGEDDSQSAPSLNQPAPSETTEPPLSPFHKFALSLFPGSRFLEDCP